MAIERWWKAVSSHSFLTDGNTGGDINVTDACEFKVKQRVVISAVGEPELVLEIKRICSPTKIKVGPKGGNIKAVTDITSYTVAKLAAIRAEEQGRPPIDSKDTMRATYEEEPAMAWRNILVDCYGEVHGKKNPLPVVVDGITISGAQLNVQLSRQNDDPTAGDIHDSTRIGSQTLEWDFRATCDAGLGEGRVADTLHCGGSSAVITVGDTPVAITVTGTAKSDRKTVYLRARAKGLYWGFNANVTADDTATGGDPMGKLQPFEFNVEANTPVYIVGPPGGVKIFVAEA